MPAVDMMARLPINELGGARVFRACKVGAKDRHRGEELSAELLATLNPSALKALIDQRFIIVWPKMAPNVRSADGEVYVYNRLGTSTYDVILGQKLNDQPLSKADAEALVAQHRKPAAA